MKICQSHKLIGQRFGRLVVVERLGVIAGCVGKNVYWRCRCDCGGAANKIGRDLVRVGKWPNVSIGCKMCLTERRSLVRKTHGQSSSLIYRRYHGMRNRCLSKKNIHYKNYGGKGIKICDEWLKNFFSFKEWAMKSGYRKGMTLDRKDNFLGYSPENCQWLTRKENGKKSSDDRYEKEKLILEKFKYVLGNVELDDKEDILMKINSFLKHYAPEEVSVNGL